MCSLHFKNNNYPSILKSNNPQNPNSDNLLQPQKSQESQES